MTRSLQADAMADLLTALQEPGSAEDRWRLVRELHALGERYRFDDGSEIVFSYRLCQAVLRSPMFVKGGEHVSSIPISTAFTQAQHDQLKDETPANPGLLSSLDNPDHSRLRRLVSVAFTARAVEIYRQSARIALDEALSALNPRQPVDLVSGVCRPVPQFVIGQLVGVALPDREEFAELSRRNSAGMDPNSGFEAHLDAARARRRMFDYIYGVIGNERSNPTDTPLGHLVAFQDSDGEISDEELVSLVTLLYTAGFRTTVMMLVNGTVELMRNPALSHRLRVDPPSVRSAVDEFLRHEPPVMSVGNVAAEGAELDGVPVTRGARITALIGAANHDPRVFADPEVFDIDRPRDPQPMTFGFGAHYCLGAALTRIEGEVYFAEMAARFPRMRLVESPRRAPAFRYNTYSEVSVVLEP